MDNNEKNSKLIELVSRYGTYLLAILCIITVAVASVFMLPKEQPKGAKNIPPKNAIGTTDQVAKSRDQSLNDILDPLTGKEIGAMKRPKEKSTPAPTPVPDFTKAPESSDGANIRELLSPPVDGEITWHYAMNELIYSPTLNQWTTHSGVDIACRQGDPVRAVADGVVEKVYEDDGFGITVIISHKDKHYTFYSNLAKSDQLIEQGAKVKANDIIGLCGNTARFECADKSHIHFEYHVDGKPVNPEEYVRLRK